MAENENPQTLDNRVAITNYNPTATEDYEIENIQRDLGLLISSINNFISVQPKAECLKTDNYEYTNDTNTTEKDDGPPEKCAGELANTTLTDTCDGNAETEVTEVDWSVAGPVLQKHVSDLERLHALNVATSSILKRVKKLAIEKSIRLLENKTREEAKLKESLEM